MPIYDLLTYFLSSVMFFIQKGRLKNCIKNKRTLEETVPAKKQ